MAENTNQPEEQVEDWKEYNERVTFIVDEQEIFWTPESDYLSAMPGTMASQISESVEDLITALDDQGYIQVTPEGPSLPADVKNLYTVVWAFNELYKDQGVKVVGNAPTLEDMGLDEASNYDDNGNLTVR
jgi:hypothetical protein